MVQKLRITSIVLLIFNGISGCFGGWGLVSAPDGSILQMPVEWLQYSPFRDYLIPGIILLVMNGILSLVISVFTIMRHRSYPFLVIFQGAVLTGWIVIQMIMIRMVHWLHLLYGLTGIVLIVMGWLILNALRTKE